MSSFGLEAIMSTAKSDAEKERILRGYDAGVETGRRIEALHVKKALRALGLAMAEDLE